MCQLRGLRGGRIRVPPLLRAWVPFRALRGEDFCEKNGENMVQRFFLFGVFKTLLKGSLVEKLPSYGDLKMQRVQYSNSSSSSAK